MPQNVTQSPTTAWVTDVITNMARSKLQKRASQLDPNSVSNMEDSVQGQYVTQKLQHKGENFEPAGQTSYGKQQSRDLTNQGPNTGPLAETQSVLPQDGNPKNDLPGNELMDVFDSAGEPDKGMGEPENQGEPVDEKLQLKKEASALNARFDELNALGQQITEYMMSLVAAEKSAAATPGTPVYNAESVLNDIKSQQNVALAAEENIKKAALELSENMIYAAEATALVLDERQKQAQVSPPTQQQPSYLPALSWIKRAAGEEQLPPQQDIGAEAAMGAMQQPTGMETGDPEDISAEEADALMQQSLAANGIEQTDEGSGGLGDINSLPDEEGDIEGGVEGGVEGGLPTEGAGDGISPEEMALFQQAMQQAGITEEDIAQAVAEIQAEQGSGISLDDAMAADADTAKTGHYKFASLVPQRQAKTADQEKRSALIRGMIRDFYYGPVTTNFN
jgi:hypothetical protein